MVHNITTIVLAGGKGLRLGQQKASLKLNGITLIEQVVERLSVLDTEIIIVISQAQTRLPANLRAKIITDIYPDKRALGGIYSGLTASGSFYNLVVACDMPFLSLDLIRYMISVAPGYDIAIPKVGSNVEPLHAVYSKSCLEHIEKMFKQGNLQVSSLLKSVNVRYVEEAEIDKYDPEHLSFFNINDLDDLERAKSLTEAMTK